MFLAFPFCVYRDVQGGEGGKTSIVPLIFGKKIRLILPLSNPLTTLSNRCTPVCVCVAIVS